MFLGRDVWETRVSLVRSGSTVDRDGRRERATRAMGDAAEVEDARVALTLIDASRYEPVTFAPWEDDGEKVTRARWRMCFERRRHPSRDARRRAVRQTPSRARQSFSASSTPCATRARDAPWTRNRRDRRDGRARRRGRRRCRRGRGEARRHDRTVSREGWNLASVWIRGLFREREARGER